MADLVCCRFRMPLEQFLRHQDEPRRAKAALESAVLDERLRDRMQLAAGSESLDGNDCSAVGKSRQVKTSAHRDPVHECRTTAAEPLPATLACSIQTELATQDLEQGFMSGDLRNCRTPIQLESDGPAMSSLHHSLPNGRSWAWRNARNTRSAVSGISVMRTSMAS